MRWLTLAAIVLPGGIVLLALAGWIHRERTRQQFESQSWNRQIAALTPDTLLPLPPVKPLKTERQPSLHRLYRFQDRMRG